MLTSALQAGDPGLRGAQRKALIITTAVAVISDATLIPFYPQLFEQAFGVRDPWHVGVYLAATCLVAMGALPVWARLERRFSTLRLLLWGQAGAGLLGLACHRNEDLLGFWVLSLAMIAFKCSYLLVYPYVMRLTGEDGREDTIGLLTVIVHLGGIAGAAAGGAILEVLQPRHLFVVMAAGDFLQMGVCVGLVLAGAMAPEEEVEAEVSQPLRWWDPRSAMTRLALVMAVFYGAVFVVRPFFVPWWELQAPGRGPMVAGFVFALPAFMSLVSVAARRLGRPLRVGMASWLLVGFAGLALQAVPWAPAVLVGRAAFGLSVFAVMVQLDVDLFERSRPADFARNFSFMNIAQQLGVLVSFYAAGSVVASGGLQWPWYLACGGFLLTAIFHRVFFESSRPALPAVLEEGVSP